MELVEQQSLVSSVKRMPHTLAGTQEPTRQHQEVMELERALPGACRCRSEHPPTQGRTDQMLAVAGRLLDDRGGVLGQVGVGGAQRL